MNYDFLYGMKLKCFIVQGVFAQDVNFRRE